MDSLADDFKTALTLKVPTSSISAHFSSDSDHKSDSSSVGDCFGSHGGSEGRCHAVPKISIGFLDSAQTTTSQGSMSSTQLSIGMSQSNKSNGSYRDLLSKGNKMKMPSIAIIEDGQEEESKDVKKIVCNKQDDYVSNLPTISLAELAKHNTWKDQWTAVDGLVYNVTMFAPQHPGGKSILQGAGKDATDIFHKRHSGLELKNTPVAKCCIGRLCQDGEKQTYVAQVPGQRYANQRHLDIF